MSRSTSCPDRQMKRGICSRRAYCTQVEVDARPIDCLNACVRTASCRCRGVLGSASLGSRVGLDGAGVTWQRRSQHRRDWLDWLSISAAGVFFQEIHIT